MTFRTYLSLMSFATLLCWGAVVAVIASVDPFTSGVFGMSLFYGSTSLALVGTFALAGIVARKVLFHEEPHFRRVAVAFRQAILFALLVVVLLMLSRAQLLRWWLILLLVAFFTTIEYLLLSILQRRSTPANNP